jgi:hypothetical protein
MRSLTRLKLSKPITRTNPSNLLMNLEEVLESDRQYFLDHPDEEEFIREFCPGEFGKAELPEIPPGFRFATCVSRIWRDGEPVGRYRELMTVSE